MIKWPFTSQLLFVFAFVLPHTASAQNGWQPRNAFPGGSRMNATSLSLGYGYVGLGSTSTNGPYLNDFWSYDEANDTWMQVATFPGAPRAYATSFSVNNRGYVGAGKIQTWPFVASDFWEFNASANTWTQIPDVPGGSKYAASGFEWNAKGFVVGGIDSVGNVLSTNWGYDATTGLWAARATYPGNGIARAVVIFGSLIVTGIDNSGNYISSAYYYNPINNTWLLKAPFAGVPRVDAGSVGASGAAYVALGEDDQANLLSDAWHYNFTTDTWTQFGSFPSTPRRGACGMSINVFPAHGVFVGGLDATDTLDQVWMLDSTFKLVVQEHVTPLANVFPSIADQVVTFSFVDPTQSHSVIIFDAQGKECYRTSTHASAIVVVVENFAAGVYSYRVDANGMMSGGKFVVGK